MSHQTSSTVSKVVLDTSVIVSASVYGSYVDLGIELHHQFYEKTIPLFDIIKKHIEKRVGIITLTVENQAIAVIASAVASELEQKADELDDPQLRADLFESHAVFFDQCLGHLQDNLSLLQREPVVLNIKKEQCYVDVTQMYNELQAVANSFNIEELIRANVAQRYRQTIRHEIREQYKKRHRQLLKLKSEPVEESDKIILCEAITILRIYRKKEPNVQMYLASTDYHFSPSDSGGEIAKQIRKRFGIICDWPDKVASYLKSNGLN